MVNNEMWLLRSQMTPQQNHPIGGTGVIGGCVSWVSWVGGSAGPSSWGVIWLLSSHISLLTIEHKRKRNVTGNRT